MQEALEAQWLLFKLDSWKAQAVGKGESVLFFQQDSRHEPREQNRIKVGGGDPAFQPPPPPSKF